MTSAPMTIEQVPLDQLRPDPANPRRIGDDELDALERSLRQFGFVQPVLARREDRTVVGGHQRLVAARRLGLATVPVIWLDLSVEQARLLNLALNKISGSWDDALLARLLADLQSSPDVDLSLSGFGEDEIKDLLRSLETREKREQVVKTRGCLACARARVVARSPSTLLPLVDLSYWHCIDDGVHGPVPARLGMGPRARQVSGPPSQPTTCPSRVATSGSYYYQQVVAVRRHRLGTRPRPDPRGQRETPMSKIVDNMLAILYIVHVNDF